MSFWAGSRLKNRLRQEKLVEPFDEARIECSAYALGLGAYTFTTSDAIEGDATQAASGSIELKEKQQISIPPGQFAFLLTEEVVTVPPDAIAFISLKTRRKFEGLVNVSGFHVDPGWSSRLIFGVLNAGPSPIVLERKQPLFLLFFADLVGTPDEPVDRENTYKGRNCYTNIPPDLVQKMSGPVPSLYRLDRATKDLQGQFRDVQASARYATLTAGLALVIAVAMLGILGKTIFFPAPPPAPVAAAPIDSSRVSPAVNVTVGPQCSAPTCVPPTKKEGHSQESQSQSAAH